MKVQPREGAIVKTIFYNNFTYESFFSVTFGIVAVIILFCFLNVLTSPCYKEMFY